MRVVNIRTINGYASVAFVRGKKRYVYSYEDVELEWEATVRGDTVSGRMTLLDVVSDCMGEFEMEASTSRA